MSTPRRKGDRRPVPRKAPGGKAPGGKAPGGKVPGGKAPGGKVPGGKVPGGKVPGGKVPGGKVPGGKVPGGKVPEALPPVAVRVPLLKVFGRQVLRPRVRRVDVAVAALLALLGFAAAVQVRSTNDGGVLSSARQQDLVRILDDLSNRSDRIRQEVTDLSATQAKLTSGTDRQQAALTEIHARTQLLALLAGTVGAQGPGIILTVTDPKGQVGAEDLLDALEELRDAGAEAIELDGGVTGPGPGSSAVRVVASTSLVDVRSGGIRVDGVLVTPSYRFVVVGNAGTLASALAIPGGVMDNISQRGGTASVLRETQVRVTALHAVTAPRYARPAAP